MKKEDLVLEAMELNGDRVLIDLFVDESKLVKRDTDGKPGLYYHCIDKASRGKDIVSNVSMYRPDFGGVNIDVTGGMNKEVRGILSKGKFVAVDATIVIKILMTYDIKIDIISIKSLIGLRGIRDARINIEEVNKIAKLDYVDKYQKYTELVSSVSTSDIEIKSRVELMVAKSAYFDTNDDIQYDKLEGKCKELLVELGEIEGRLGFEVTNLKELKKYLYRKLDSLGEIDKSLGLLGYYISEYPHIVEFKDIRRARNINKVLNYIGYNKYLAYKRRVGGLVSLGFDEYLRSKSKGPMLVGSEWDVVGHKTSDFAARLDGELVKVNDRKHYLVGVRSNYISLKELEYTIVGDYDGYSDLLKHISSIAYGKPNEDVSYGDVVETIRILSSISDLRFRGFEGNLLGGFYGTVKNKEEHLQFDEFISRYENVDFSRFNSSITGICESLSSLDNKMKSLGMGICDILYHGTYKGTTVFRVSNKVNPYRALKMIRDSFNSVYPDVKLVDEFLIGKSYGDMKVSRDKLNTMGAGFIELYYSKIEKEKLNYIIDTVKSDLREYNKNNKQE